MTSQEEIAKAVEIANQEGLRGRRVYVIIVPPATASSQAAYVIIPLHRDATTFNV